MRVLKHCAFKSGFPDDATYDDTGDFEFFAGRNVSEAIKAMLEGMGGVVSEPKHCFEEGWEMAATFGARRIWFRVTPVEEFVLLSEDQTTLFSRWFNKKIPTYADILTKLNAAMRRDP